MPSPIRESLMLQDFLMCDKLCGSSCCITVMELLTGELTPPLLAWQFSECLVFSFHMTLVSCSRNSMYFETSSGYPESVPCLLEFYPLFQSKSQSNVKRMRKSRKRWRK